MKLGRIPFGGIFALLCCLSGGVWAQVVTEFSSGISGGFYPVGITAGPDGNVWFTENGALRIGKITPAGVVTEYSSGLTFGAGNGITAGPDGNLWFTEAGDRIGKITTAGVITEYSISAGSQPNQITAGPDGNLWFTEFGGRIGTITTAGVVTYYNSGISAGAQPFHIAAGPDGNLWFTEVGERIGKITPAGVVTEYSNGIGAGATLAAIAAGPDGNLWFVEFGGNRIGKITTAGVVTEYSSGISAGASPRGITAGADGNLWFTESDAIGKITPAGVVTEYSSGISAGAQPNEITAGPDGNLWFTEFGAHQIGRITTGAAAPPGTASVVEYYYAKADEYFISADPAEISTLDNNRFPGWVRTGLGFAAYATATAGASPVCRFFIPPASHFFSASPAECALTQQRFPSLVYEASDVFYIPLPDTATGACPAGTVPVYRLFDNRADPNHRYTTSTAVVDQMHARGWIPEGYGSGPYYPIMCSPSVATPCMPNGMVPQALLSCRNWISFSPPSPFNPNQNVFPDDSQLTLALTQLFQEGWRGLVTYSLDGTLGDVPRIAKQVGFSTVIAGLFWFDDAQLAREKTAALAAVQFIDGFVLGNEGLQFGRYTRQRLEMEIASLRTNTGRPVTTNEPFNQYQSDPTLLNVGDWAFPNIHPWLQGIRSIPTAVSFVQATYQSLQSLAPNRTVVVKEAWWPTAVDPPATEPAATEANQTEFFRELAATNTAFVWGEAYDQFWKTAEGPQGPHWGFHKSDMTAKDIVSSRQTLYIGSYGRPVPHSGDSVSGSWTRAMAVRSHQTADVRDRSGTSNRAM